MMSETEFKLSLANSFILFLLNSIAAMTNDKEVTKKSVEYWSKNVELFLDNTQKQLIKKHCEQTGESEDVVRILFNIHSGRDKEIIKEYVEYIVKQIEEEFDFISKRKTIDEKQTSNGTQQL